LIKMDLKCIHFESIFLLFWNLKPE
jgi:hypothetical protein